MHGSRSGSPFGNHVTLTHTHTHKHKYADLYTNITFPVEQRNSEAHCKGAVTISGGANTPFFLPCL